MGVCWRQLLRMGRFTEFRRVVVRLRSCLILQRPRRSRSIYGIWRWTRAGLSMLLWGLLRLCIGYLLEGARLRFCSRRRTSIFGVCCWAEMERCGQGAMGRE